VAIALVQSTSKVVNGAASTTLAFGANLAAGNFLTTAQADFASPNVGTSTPTDTRGHTYTGARAEFGVDGLNRGRIFYVKSTTAGADTVTMGQSRSGDFTIAIAECSGGDATDPRAAETGTDGTGTGTAVNLGSTGVRADADGMILAWFSHTGADTALTEDTANGFSMLQENEGGSSNMPLHVQYKITTNTTAITVGGAAGASRTWFGQEVTFKAAAGGGPPATTVQPPMRTLRGAGV
jgi:hypothetical protein